MELYQLECFRVLCKHGNFTSASEELMVTQPAVSMAVKKLEEEYGAELINRQDKSFIITPAGETVLKHAIAIHNEVAELRQELSVSVCKNQEIIRLAIPGTMGLDQLMKLAADFSLQHNDVSLSIFQKGHAAIAEGLANQTIDVGVLSKDMLSTLMNYRDYAQVEIYAAFSPEHRFNHYGSITPELLAQENLLFSKMPNRVPGYILRYFSEQGVKPSCTYCNTFPDGCAELAQRGQGIALVPKEVAGENAAPLFPPLYCDLVVAWNKKDLPTQEMQALISFLTPSV